MPRPRTHDLDALMDAAEKLAVESGAHAVTIRGLSQVTGVSNGAVYHAFGSRAGLLGRVWLRDARRLLAVQRKSVDAVLSGRTSDAAVDAVLAAADAPAVFLLDLPMSARFLLAVSRQDLLRDDDIPPDVAEQLVALDSNLTELFIDLARAVWGRSDRTAVAVIKDCVVELPTALLLRGNRTPDDAVRQRLAAAVRGILTLPPPHPPTHP
ncbi:TetR family transcriptional regulator [Rhodococcus sp. 06-1059B-a]|nr:helix-turn-helix domain-containing protein [Rhodococcus sp. 06-1059B-a]OZD58612.1 TetR family transcriptional regulator [Rhodococcus sp. 06-1059B-a]